jgi:hypothetical protein
MFPYISGATGRYKKFWEELTRVFDLTLFNDPAINLNNLFKNLLRCDSQTEIRQEVKLFSKIKLITQLQNSARGGPAFVPT